MKTKPTPVLDPTKCSKMISTYINGWYRGEHQCPFKWSVVTTEDRKHYCKRHSPDAVKKRGQRQTTKYEYEQARRAMGLYGHGLYNALEAMFDPESGTAAIKTAKKALKTARPYCDILKKGKPR